MRLLVADDNENFRRLIAELLRHEGYEVEEVSDGQALLDAALARFAKVIIADVRLPGLSALEVVRRLEQARIESSIVLMSGSADDATREAAAALGVLFMLEKPFGFDALLDTVRASSIP